jgi:hypothetical protein
MRNREVIMLRVTRERTCSANRVMHFHLESIRAVTFEKDRRRSRGQLRSTAMLRLIVRFVA